MSKCRFLGVLIPNLDDYFWITPPWGHTRWGEGGGEGNFFIFDQYHHVGCIKVEEEDELPTLPISS